ncbi:MAG: WD40/YVTN/BNR-like repeat-containing protein, partial [Longimicrobiales bacterium]
MKARSVGPSGQGGRINAVDALVENPDVIYVGAAAGGVWRSRNAGTTWEPLFDDQPVQSIGALAVDQRNPDVIWVGTGEGSPRNSVNHGNGVYKSIDGGRTWRHLGLEGSRAIHRILLHPDDPDIAYLAVVGSPFGDSEQRGVYRTRDGGETWERTLFVDARTGAADLVMDPRNPNKLIASMWSHRRQPWTFYSGGDGSGIYVSYDGGDSWDRKTSEDGLPEGELGRIGLAISASEPDIVYALVEASRNALLRSDDGGRSFETVNTDEGVNPRPFYYADIFVDPSNENRLYRVAGRVDVSEDGGKTFETWVSGEVVHVDHHAWWIHPDDPNLIIDGNDGGAAISRDRGRHWQVFHNLPIGQFYHVNVDEQTPYNIYGGAQDNDSFRGPSYAWNFQGIQNHQWENLGCCADGFDMAPDPRNDRFGYVMHQGGALLRYDRATSTFRRVTPSHEDEADLRFNWNAALALDPIRPGRVWFGSQYLHVSDDDGLTWRTVSPDLTTNDPERQRQAESGGLTTDATGAENNTTIVTIAPSPVQDGVIWVGTDDGNVQLTRDGGVTWTNLIDEMSGAPAGAWVPQIHASSHSAGEAFVVIEDHRRDDWTPYVFHTRDFGASWRR